MSVSPLCCTTCDAPLAAPLDPARGPWRCARCGVTIGSGFGSPRWAYPRVAPLDVGHGASDPTGLTADSDDAAPRELSVAGRYQLREVLGRGGMGIVYRAWDPELARTVALKVLTAGPFAAPGARARFVAEARTAAAVVHPGIVRVFDVGAHGDQPFFTMEEVRGPSLGDVVDDFAPLDPHEAARIGQATAEAVHHAHTQQVAHRDLKPANVLLTTEGEPLVTDFGIAKALDATHDLTNTRDVLGTPTFMAPEVARGERDVDWVRVDVYGLGAVLYAALARRPPVAQASSLSRTLEVVASGRIPTLRSLRPDVPAPLAAIVHQALHLEPDRRYASADQLARDLARWRAGDAVHARPETPLERAGRLLRRNRRAVALAGASLGLVLLAALGSGALQQARWAAREAAATRAWGVVHAHALDLVADGEEEAAHAAIRTFVDAPQHRGTEAVFRASMTLGDLIVPYPKHASPIEDQRPLDAWARALQDAPTDPLRAEALLRLARWLVDSDRYPELEPVLDALEALPGQAALEPRIAPLRLAWAVYTGRTQVAAAAWERARALGLPDADRYADPRLLPRALPRGQRLGAAPEVGAPVWPDDDGALDAAGDVDGDGVIEAYGYRYVAREGVVRERDGRVEVLGPEVGVPVTHDVNGVAVADLDGDGAPELVVGGSEWSAYDLRVLGADGAGGLRLRARVHRNATGRVTTLRDPWRPGQQLVASTETDLWISRRVHGDARPSGPPQGLLVRRLVADRLEEVFFWGGDPGAALFAWDLDGDGTQELLLTNALEPTWRGGSVTGTLVLFAGAEPDTFRIAALPHVSLLPDPDEGGGLVAHVRRGDVTERWRLGTGDQILPPASPIALSARVQHPDPPRGPGQAAWDRLRTVSQAGFLRQAAAGFEQLSRTSEASMAAAAAREAARTWAALDRPDRAAEAWERAARLAAPARAPERWQQAVTAWLDVAMPDRALEAAAAWRQADGRGPTGDLARALERWDAARQRRVALGAGLDDGLRIEEPLAVEVEGDHLRIDTAHDARDLLVLPLEREEEPLFLAAEVDLDVAEWAGSLDLEVGGAGHTGRIGLGTSGGGGYLFLCGSCVLDGEQRSGRCLPLRDGRNVARVRLAFTPWDERWTCFVGWEGYDHAESMSRAVPVSPTGQPWSLRARSEETSLLGQWLGVEVRGLEIWGADVPAVVDPDERARLALARGEPGGASALAEPLARALAHVQLADLSAAEAALREADAAGELEPHVPYLLKVRPERWARLVRSAVGPDRYLELFDGVWRGAPVDELHVQRAYTEDLVGLDLSEHPMIAAFRARALLAAGQIPRGTAAAEAWLDGWAPDDVELAEQASALHRDLARVAAAAGDAERARQHAEASVAASPWPELARDRLERIDGVPRSPGADGRSGREVHQR